jgi:hypothetical protein
MTALCGDGTFTVDRAVSSLSLLVVLVMFVVGGYLLFALPVRNMVFGCNLPESNIVTRYDAFRQLCVWLIAIVLYVVLNEG